MHRIAIWGRWAFDFLLGLFLPSFLLGLLSLPAGIIFCLLGVKLQYIHVSLFVVVFFVL